jgi:hypothetical protein
MRSGQIEPGVRDTYPQLGRPGQPQLTQADGLTKSYGRVRALDRVGLELRPVVLAR